MRLDEESKSLTFRADLPSTHGGDALIERHDLCPGQKWPELGAIFRGWSNWEKKALLFAGDLGFASSPCLGDLESLNSLRQCPQHQILGLRSEVDGKARGELIDRLEPSSDGLRLFAQTAHHGN
jgi:hypothetical protein